MPVHHDGPLRWLARLVANCGISFSLVAAVVIVDFTIPWQGIGSVPRAIVDEPCHVAISLVILGTLTRFRGTPPDPKFGWSMLAYSTAATLTIDKGTSIHLDRRKLLKDPKQEVMSCA
jgi:hypothetical protein